MRDKRTPKDFYGEATVCTAHALLSVYEELLVKTRIVT